MANTPQEEVHQASVRLRKHMISIGFTVPFHNCQRAVPLSGWPAGYSQRKAGCVSQQAGFQHLSPRLGR